MGVEGKMSGRREKEHKRQRNGAYPETLVSTFPSSGASRAGERLRLELRGRETDLQAIQGSRKRVPPNRRLTEHILETNQQR